MNYDEARQLKDGGWHWTSMRDRQVRTAWPCRRFASGVTADPATGYRALVKDGVEVPPAEAFEVCEAHATREEAERHFYDACLDEARESGLGDWSGCRVCDTPTKLALGNLGLGHYFDLIPLCDEHRTRERLAELNPFHGGIALVHS